MSRSLALTGIALIAASAVTGCHGGTLPPLADGTGPGVRHGQIWHGDVPQRQRFGDPAGPRESVNQQPAPRRAHGIRPGCKRVPGGMLCTSQRGFNRDLQLNDIDGGQDPSGTQADPEE
jgi:hypothetical protein